MARDVRAYLNDIIESCDAIAFALEGMDVSAYEGNRLVRSSVEREFIIIGEAVAAVSRVSPDIFERIAQARRIVDFRNQLTHDYVSVDDALVFAIATRDAPILRGESASLLESLGPPLKSARDLRGLLRGLDVSDVRDETDRF
jgi:uncharacterized protein with HEPN domain